MSLNSKAYAFCSVQQQLRQVEFITTYFQQHIEPYLWYGGVWRRLLKRCRYRRFWLLTHLQPKLQRARQRLQQRQAINRAVRQRQVLSKWWRPGLVGRFVQRWRRRRHFRQTYDQVLQELKQGQQRQRQAQNKLTKKPKAKKAKTSHSKSRRRRQQRQQKKVKKQQADQEAQEQQEREQKLEQKIELDQWTHFLRLDYQAIHFVAFIFNSWLLFLAKKIPEMKAAYKFTAKTLTTCFIPGDIKNPDNHQGNIVLGLKAIQELHYPDPKNLSQAMVEGFYFYHLLVRLLTQYAKGFAIMSSKLKHCPDRRQRLQQTFFSRVDTTLLNYWLEETQIPFYCLLRVEQIKDLLFDWLKDTAPILPRLEKLSQDIKEEMKVDLNAYIEKNNQNLIQ